MVTSLRCYCKGLESSRSRVSLRKLAHWYISEELLGPWSFLSPLFLSWMQWGEWTCWPRIPVMMHLLPHHNPEAMGPMTTTEISKTESLKTIFLPDAPAVFCHSEWQLTDKTASHLHSSSSPVQNGAICSVSNILLCFGSI